MTARLKITYDKEIINKLMSKLSLKNKHEVPKFEKIILVLENSFFLCQTKNQYKK